MQGTRVRALVREDPTCRGATKPVRHNYRACALEPTSHNYWAHVPRACALQQEKPPQWEARLLQLEKARAQQQRPNAAKKKKKERHVKDLLWFDLFYRILSSRNLSTLHFRTDLSLPPQILNLCPGLQETFV